MTLSSRTQKRLQAAHESEATYQPNKEVAALLNQKTLVMIIGPAAIGKNFIIDTLIKTDPTFGFVPSFSTREPRTNDEPGSMHLYLHDEVNVNRLLDLIEAGGVAQYAIHPTTGHIYGTMTEDFSRQFALLPTLTTAVESIQQLPFNKTIPIILAASPQAWKARFNQRYPQKSDERNRRRAEAISSLVWGLAAERRDTVYWVDNTSSDPHTAVQRIINIVKYNHQGDPEARKHAERMLELAVDEL